MTLTDRVGFGKFLFNVGKEYGDLLRGSFTSAGVVAYIAGWAGLDKGWALAVGVLVLPVTIGVSITAGWAIVRWRVIHATIEREWANNPFQRAQTDLLRDIYHELHALRVAPTRVSPPAYPVNVMELR